MLYLACSIALSDLFCERIVSTSLHGCCERIIFVVACLLLLLLLLCCIVVFPRSTPKLIHRKKCKILSYFHFRWFRAYAFFSGVFIFNFMYCSLSLSVSFFFIFCPVYPSICLSVYLSFFRTKQNFGCDFSWSTVFFCITSFIWYSSCSRVAARPAAKQQDRKKKKKQRKKKN